MKKLVNLSIGFMVIIGFIYFFTNTELKSSGIEINNHAEVQGLPVTKVLQEKIDIAEEVQLDVPLVNQMDAPRLYNGCEVTSLAMILNYKGISVTKNKLAQEITRVPLQYSNGTYGNPNMDLWVIWKMVLD